jgi:flavin reductase (DIM6/NTAB) family NADH-FMN oxidoreductase RutF
MTIKIDPKEVSTPKFHGMMLGAIAPRPIAFASTVDKQGNVNLSPFSFFNCFGANPPILIFSPARRVRDNSTKHTLENVYEHPEVVINIVNYATVEQMSLASTEYDKGINEFIKSGLTPANSDRVKPPRVQEAPAAFECKVNEIVPLGEEGGAGNLVICEVLLMHVQESILDAEGRIDPHLLDAVGRMGGDFYCRASGDAVFEVAKPTRHLGIGIDQLPEHIKTSKILTGNDLAKLGNTELAAIPDENLIQEFSNAGLNNSSEEQRHLIAQKFLEKGDVEAAWKVLLSNKGL